MDQRNEVRNARGVRTWVGHCPQLFVSLGDRTWKSADEIRKAIGSAPGRVALVEGHLGAKHAAGVLIWRDVPDVKDTTIENAANALVKHFTDNPVAPPEVTCTVPVLERALML